MATHVQTGADLLRQAEASSLRGKRLGLLTNPTGIDAGFRSTIDICAGLEGARLTALFACEHGIRGEKQAGLLFGDETDPELGLPVYSLYGENRRPTAEMLAGLDAVVFDIQDLGVRFYTYLTTLVYLMQACADNGKEVIVLDRPNPLGGYGSEGGFMQPGFYSMVGAWNVPIRTGLTIGEFASLVRGQMEKPCELQVIGLRNWDRSMEYPETGLPWLLPSPNMPTMETVRLYAGTCFFEGTNLSEGRGTTKPFEIIGAPWLNSRELCRRMNRIGLPGIHFHPVTFTPMFSKHQGALCQGVHAFVTDRSVYESVPTGLHLLHQIETMHPEHFEWLVRPKRENGEAECFIDILTGSEAVRRTVGQPDGPEKILESWSKDTAKWREIRRPYLLYPEGPAS